jgi:hypothetical protein
MEPVFRASTPDGRWVITVTCTLSEEGEPLDWSGVVTLDGNHVVEAMKTEDSDKLVRWTHRQMREAMRRTTEEVP